MDRIARLAAHLQGPQPSSGVEGLSLSVTAANAGGKFKVALLGAAGGIGQPLGLLLKMYPLIGELSLYDIVGTEGVGADISHMDTSTKVKSYTGHEKLGEALYGCNLVLIPAGVPRKPGMTRDDLFNINAGIVKSLCEAIAKYCPQAWVAIISNPVNSTVPIAAEVFKKAGTYDPRKLLGVTKLDVVRAKAFVGEAIGVNPEEVNVPVIGGHAGITILPLLSQATPRANLPPATVKALTERIQDAGTEVVKAKAGKGSATLSMAYAAAKFAESCLYAMAGRPGVVECAYVQSAITDLPFFASQLRLGVNGVEEFLPLGAMTDGEKAGLQALKAELTDSIKKGVDFANKGEGSTPPFPTPSQVSLPGSDKNTAIEIQAALDEMPSGGALIGEQLRREQPQSSRNSSAGKAAWPSVGGVPGQTAGPGVKSGVPSTAEETTGVYYGPPAFKVQQAMARAHGGKGRPSTGSHQPMPSNSMLPSEAAETTGGLYMPRNKKLPERSSTTPSGAGQ